MDAAIHIPGPFESIVFPRARDSGSREAREAPAFFHDLNLEQIVSAVTAGREDYNLAPLFHARLEDEDEIHYRQEVFRDLENEGVMQAVQGEKGLLVDLPGPASGAGPEGLYFSP